MRSDACPRGQLELCDLLFKVRDRTLLLFEKGLLVGKHHLLLLDNLARTLDSGHRPAPAPAAPPP